MKHSRGAENSELTNRLTPYRHIIWDWNGTLIDDVELAVAAINLLLEEYALAPVEKEHYREVFGFPVSNYYLKLGFDLKSVTMDQLSTRFHHNYNSLLRSHSRLFPDVELQLSTLKSGRKLSILSAGAQWHLDQWVKTFGVEHYFDHIFGINNHNATSKLERGQELIAISGIPTKETILVGDTDHDCDVGRQLGVDVLLVANGHQTFERLTNVHHNVIKCRFSSGD